MIKSYSLKTKTFCTLHGANGKFWQLQALLSSGCLLFTFCFWIRKFWALTFDHLKSNAWSLLLCQKRLQQQPCRDLLILELNQTVWTGPKAKFAGQHGLSIHLNLCLHYVFSVVENIDLSIGSTETIYIKLNTKTHNIFCCLNENLTTFLYTLTGGTRKQKEKKVFSLKVYTKVECY